MSEQEYKDNAMNVESQEAGQTQEATDNQTCAHCECGKEACTEESGCGKETCAEEAAESPLDKANKEIELLKDKYLRTLAEFENYKKRTLKEKTELILNGSEKTVVAVLPVMDDFERAIKDESDDPQAIKEGVKMIFNKFVKTLEGLGVKKIDTDGKDFDTDFHEAVAMVPGMGDDKKGKVIDCIQTGYTLNDKVIRHAKVAVGQ